MDIFLGAAIGDTLSASSSWKKGAWAVVGMATEVEEDDDRELDDWTQVVDGGG